MTVNDDATVNPLRTEQVWIRFSAPLLRWFEERTGDRERAEELLAQTFLRIHETLPSLSDDERLGAWVHALARNIWTDALRARGHAMEPLEEETDAGAGSDGELLLEEVASWLTGFLLQLSEDERELLRAIDTERKPLKQVARELGISETAVKSRVRRARRALRNRLEACCHVEWGQFGEIVDYHRREGGCSCTSSC